MSRWGWFSSQALLPCSRKRVQILGFSEVSEMGVLEQSREG